MIGLVLVATYIVLFHVANPEPVEMLLLPPMPVALFVALVAVVAWFIGWLPGRLRGWRLQRRLAAVQAERERLAAELEHAQRAEPSDPVIPDREAAGIRHSEDPTDYL